MDAWFSPQIAQSFAYLAFLSLLSMLSPLAHRGEKRVLVVGAYGAAMVLGIALLFAGLLGVLLNQPGYVVFTLVLSGVVIAPICAVALATIIKAYKNAELRKTIARDL